MITVTFESSLDTMWLDGEMNHVREYFRCFPHRETKFIITKNPHSFDITVVSANYEKLWASDEADLLGRLGAYLTYY